VTRSPALGGGGAARTARTACARVLIRGGTDEKTGEALPAAAVAERVAWCAALVKGMAARLTTAHWEAGDLRVLASWVEGQVPPPPVTPGQNPGLAEATNSVEPVDPSAVLGLLKSAVSVQAEGPASGPGWTGTKYAFTTGPYTDAGMTGTTAGTVYVDDQGRVRQLVVTGTFRLPGTSTMHEEVGYTYDATFGEFGVRVSVTPPPASQVHNLGKGYLILDPGLGFLVVSPPVPQ
jgi:hypothetical protein